MGKLKISDLKKLREDTKEKISLRKDSARATITVHMGTCGIAAGAREIMTALMDELKAEKAADIFIKNAGCAGLCSHEPMITVEMKGEAPVKYVNLTDKKAREIFKSHVINGKILKDYALALGHETTL
jgi:NADP-reducing hydrogenase subunit HndB